MEEEKRGIPKGPFCRRKKEKSHLLFHLSLLVSAYLSQHSTLPTITQINEAVERKETLSQKQTRIQVFCRKPTECFTFTR